MTISPFIKKKRGLELRGPALTYVQYVHEVSTHFIEHLTLLYKMGQDFLDIKYVRPLLKMWSSNEVSGSALFQIMELPAVRRTQPITKGKNFFNNPCPIATMVTW